MSRLLPVLALLLAIGLFFGYINPTYTSTVSALQAEIESYDSALAAAERFKEKEAELTIERNALPAESLARLEAMLPDGVDNVQLILDLDALASRTGMELTNFDTTDTLAAEDTATDGVISLEDEDPVDSVELSMTGTGTYASFRSFLEGIEGSLRPLDLIALEVQSTATGVYTYNMTFRLYWLR